MSRLVAIACLLGATALSAAALAQTSPGASPGTGSKVEALPAPDRTTPSTAPAVPGQAPRNGEAGRSESGGSAR